MENKEEPNKTEILGFGNGNIVSARGTGEGLIIKLDCRCADYELVRAIREFADNRQSFLEGNEVILEWFGAKPGGSLVSQISNILKDEFAVVVKSSNVITRKEEQPKSLFDGMEALNDDYKSGVAPEKTGSSFVDEADAKIIYGVLRGGQKIESEHSVILIGDLNSGAEIISGGNIIVLGALRGVVHAGAFDESGGGKYIMSLEMKPTQLRIGSVISRGENLSKQAEIAWVDDGNIVVQPYEAKILLNRKKI